MLDEIKQILFRFGLTLVLIFGLAWFFKHSTKASIGSGDHYMSEATFPEGSYSVNTSLQSLSQYKSGDPVAYVLAGDPVKRIGRIVGIEGQKVSISAKGVTADNQPLGSRIEIDSSIQVTDLKVPRGCAYILSDTPQNGSDSLKNGPIPFSQILGTVKPIK